MWATPGGGQEPGEDDEATLRRELDEELGVTCADIGPHIWTRLHIIPFLDGRWDGQRDNVYLVRTEAFEPQPSLTWEQLRAERVHELRWWTPAELRRRGRRRRLRPPPAPWPRGRTAGERSAGGARRRRRVTGGGADSST